MTVPCSIEKRDRAAKKPLYESLKYDDSIGDLSGNSEAQMLSGSVSSALPPAAVKNNSQPIDISQISSSGEYLYACYTVATEKCGGFNS